MRRPHVSQFGADIWGLGVMLYAPNGSGGYIIGHDSNNDPAVNTAARVDPAIGAGIVVRETGNPLLASDIAGEWVFWKTGNVDFLSLTIQARSVLTVMVAGWLVIILAAIVARAFWRNRRPALTA